MSKVMVVDSGVGGLSIAQHVAGLAPSSLLCLSDKAFFPYGQRETHELENILISLVAQGIDHWGLPDAIVIACNTASTRILDALRARFQLPFVGVVPAVKPAAQLTTTGVFGVLATASTVNSHYLKWLIESFAAGRRVITLACNELVEAIEREISDQYVLEDDDLVSLLAPLFEGQGKHIDVLVLACTHFPLLRSRIEGVLPQLSQQ